VWFYLVATTACALYPPARCDDQLYRVPSGEQLIEFRVAQSGNVAAKRAGVEEDVVHTSASIGQLSCHRIAMPMVSVVVSAIAILKPEF